jgi:hypothetical protein
MTEEVVKSRRMKSMAQVAQAGETTNAYRVFVRRPEGRRPLRRHRRRWQYNIKVDLQEMAMEGVDWIDLALYRDKWRALVNRVQNLRVS